MQSRIKVLLSTGAETMRYQISDAKRDDPRRDREISDPILDLEYRRYSIGGEKSKKILANFSVRVSARPIPAPLFSETVRDLPRLPDSYNFGIGKHILSYKLPRL